LPVRSARPGSGALAARRRLRARPMSRILTVPFLSSSKYSTGLDVAVDHALRPWWAKLQNHGAGLLDVVRRLFDREAGPFFFTRTERSLPSTYSMTRK